MNNSYRIALGTAILFCLVLIGLFIIDKNEPIATTGNPGANNPGANRGAPPQPLDLRSVDKTPLHRGQLAGAQGADTNAGTGTGIDRNPAAPIVEPKGIAGAESVQPIKPKTSQPPTLVIGEYASLLAKTDQQQIDGKAASESKSESKSDGKQAGTKGKGEDSLARAIAQALAASDKKPGNPKANPGEEQPAGTQSINGKSNPGSAKHGEPAPLTLSNTKVQGVSAGGKGGPVGPTRQASPAPKRPASKQAPQNDTDTLAAIRRSLAAQRAKAAAGNQAPASQAPLAPTPNNTPINVLPTPKRSVPAQGQTTHMVTSGDTLSGIAKRYLGHERHWRVIAKANPNLDPNRLSLGTAIIIPSTSAIQAPKATGPSAPVATPPAGPGQLYTIAEGDRLWTIAKRFYGNGTKWTHLYRMNRHLIGPDPNRLPAGKQIRIVPLPTAAPTVINGQK